MNISSGVNVIFSKYAQHYDLIYSDKNYKSEAMRIDALIKKYAISNNSLLSLGSGTGSFEKEFELLDWNVTGIEKSEEMLSIAKNKAPAVRFVAGDISGFSLGQQFDAAVMLFHVINYVGTSCWFNVFTNVAQALKQGGVLLFDSWHAPGLKSTPPEMREKSVESERFTLKRVAEPKVISGKGIVEMKYTISVQDKQSGLNEEYSEIHTMNYLFPDEIYDLLSNAGFKIHETVDSATLKEPTAKTSNVIWVCAKI